MWSRSISCISIYSHPPVDLCTSKGGTREPRILVKLTKRFGLGVELVGLLSLLDVDAFEHSHKELLLAWRAPRVSADRTLGILSSERDAGVGSTATMLRRGRAAFGY